MTTSLMQLPVCCLARTKLNDQHQPQFTCEDCGKTWERSSLLTLKEVKDDQDDPE